MLALVAVHGGPEERGWIRAFSEMCCAAVLEVYAVGGRWVRTRVPRLSTVVRRGIPANGAELARAWEGRRPAALVVLLHGRAGHRQQLDPYVDRLAVALPDAALYVPDIIAAGLMSLEATVAQVEADLGGFRARFPDVPLCVIGISNGGRVAVHLRQHSPVLRDGAATVVAIGSPLRGTRMADLGLRMGRRGLEELRYDPGAAVDHVPGTRWIFYASRSDLLVAPYRSALPEVRGAPDGSVVRVAHGRYGHAGLHFYLADEIVRRCVAGITGRA